jgi:hypothetical protein
MTGFLDVAAFFVAGFLELAFFFAGIAILPDVAQRASRHHTSMRADRP